MNIAQAQWTPKFECPECGEYQSCKLDQKMGGWAEKQTCCDCGVEVIVRYEE